MPYLLRPTPASLMFVCLFRQSPCVTLALLAHTILLPRPKWLASLEAFSVPGLRLHWCWQLSLLVSHSSFPQGLICAHGRGCARVMTSTTPLFRSLHQSSPSVCPVAPWSVRRIKDAHLLGSFHYVCGSSLRLWAGSVHPPLWHSQRVGYLPTYSECHLPFGKTEPL